MPKIAACLIVRNSEETIEACLASIRLFVDGIFIYDTGSTDRTLELVEKMNHATGQLIAKTTGVPIDGKLWKGPIPTAEEQADREDTFVAPLAPIVVERGEWRDDFSWAREQSFAMPDESFDWLLWLDDDDLIEGAPLLRQLAASAPPELHGWVMFYDYARDELGNCVCQLWRERLIRRSAGLRWKLPVHEVLLPPDGVAPVFLQVPPDQVRYVHNRPASRALEQPDRNLKILFALKERAEADGEPVEPRTLAYLGTELIVRGQIGEAVEFLQAYLARDDARWSDERAQVHHKLASCLRVLGNPTAAVEAEMRAIRERDDWAENMIGLAAAFAQLGEWARCERWAKAGLAAGMPVSPLILNPLEHTLLPLVLIADACVNQERFDDAREAIRQAAAITPTPEIHAKVLDVERRAQDAELVGALLLLRETLVRHDENLKAWGLLQNVPYTVADHPRIVEARIAQREMVKHALKPQEYLRWYRDEPKESTVPDEAVETIDEYIDRAGYMLEGLREQEAALGRKPVALDLGCNDFWLSCFLWKKAGIRCDGVELNRASYEKGKGRKMRFGAPGQIKHGDLHDAARLMKRSYDAVSLFEVLEHVPDVGETLDLLESLVKPGGRVYLTTPNGAYERGGISGWAKIERKGHLRAITAMELGEMLLARGDVKDFRIHHADDRLTFASYEPKAKKGTVTFFAGASWEPWSPASIKQGGIGGSETALVQVATRLAINGHTVKVFSGSEPGLFGGVLYRPAQAFDPAEEVDLLVSSRLPAVADLPVGAKRLALWCHDHSYPGILTEERAAKFDDIVVLSEWERDRFARLYPFLKSKLRIIRNGIAVRDLDGSSRYPDARRSFAERKPRAIYSSSADRGLDVLLEVWPAIRERAPEAELHVFYGWDTFDRVARTNPDLWALKNRILQLAEEAGGEDGGVFFRGRVGQVELAEEMQHARVLAYPTAFLETSCITAMEARAAGLPIVTSQLAALPESAAGQILIPWGKDEDEPWNREEGYKRAFVDIVVERLTYEDTFEVWQDVALEGSDGFDWSERIPEWEKLLEPPARKAVNRKREKVSA